MEDKKSILVIGSTGHTLADMCVNWGDDFYVGDYNVIVVSLKDLTKEKLDYLKANKPGYLENIRKQAVEAQEKGLEIFCILDTFKFATHISTSTDEESRKAWNNYSWSPVIPRLENVSEGKKINTTSSKISSEYLKLVKGWSILWESSINNTGYVDQKDLVGNHQYQEIRTVMFTNPLLLNNIGRKLSFEVNWKTQRESKTSDYVYGVLHKSINPIVFLPQVDDVKQAVDIILAQIAEEEQELPPDWVAQVRVANEEEIFSKISEVQSEIISKQKELSFFEDEVATLDEYKKLLYGSGHMLEEIVEKSFEFLGINIISPVVKNKEDRLFNKDDASIPIEIRGKNSGLNEKDLNQLTSRFVDKPESESFQTRGLFVLNHFRDTEPEKRSEAFNFNIIEKAKPWQVCLIKTETIFELVKAKFQGNEFDNLETKLFNTIGVFELKNDPEPKG